MTIGPTPNKYLTFGHTHPDIEPKICTHENELDEKSGKKGVKNENMKKKCKNEKDENCEKNYVQIFARPPAYFVRSSLIFRRGVSFGLGMNELFLHA